MFWRASLACVSSGYLLYVLFMVVVLFVDYASSSCSRTWLSDAGVRRRTPGAWRARGVVPRGVVAGRSSSSSSCVVPSFHTPACVTGLLPDCVGSMLIMFEIFMKNFAPPPLVRRYGKGRSNLAYRYHGRSRVILGKLVDHLRCMSSVASSTSALDDSHGVCVEVYTICVHLV